MAKGPLGNHPRDLRDSFVGEPAPMYTGGEPPKKTRNPKKVTSNTFHTSVTGATSNKRPDRPGHFRSGGFVRGKADGGSVFPLETAEEKGRREGRKIIKQMPFNANLRSESTQRAGATDRLGKDFDSRVKTGKYERTYDEVGDDLDVLKETGKYKKGGKT
jgi:hypothetical protein